MGWVWQLEMNWEKIGFGRVQEVEMEKVGYLEMGTSGGNSRLSLQFMILV